MRFIPFFILAPAALWAAPDAAVPRISFQKPHHQFGIVNADQRPHWACTLTNTGDGVLHISRLESSCGCTSTNLGKETLLQGESTQIQIDFDPKNFLGPVKKTVLVHSNDPANPIVTLSFEAKVVRDIMAEPPLLHLHELLRTQSQKATFRLVSGNQKPVEVKEIKCPGAPYLSFSHRRDGLDVLVTVDVDGTNLPPHSSTVKERIIVRTTHPKFDPVVEYMEWDVKNGGRGEPTAEDPGSKAGSRPVNPSASQGEPTSGKDNLL